MATITFKAKAEQVWNHDGTPAYKIIKVPTLQRRHCDMATFRRHPKYGGIANSDLFPNALARIRRDMGVNYDGFIRLDRLAPHVTVDESGFLAIVQVEV